MTILVTLRRVMTHELTFLPLLLQRLCLKEFCERICVTRLVKYGIQHQGLGIRQGAVHVELQYLLCLSNWLYNMFATEHQLNFPPTDTPPPNHYSRPAHPTNPSSHPLPPNTDPNPHTTMSRPTATTESLFSRAKSLAPSVNAATGIDIDEKWRSFQDYQKDFSCASNADRGHLAKHIREQSEMYGISLSATAQSNLRACERSAVGSEPSAWVSKAISQADSILDQGLGEAFETLKADDNPHRKELASNMKSLVSDVIEAYMVPKGTVSIISIVPADC